METDAEHRAESRRKCGHRIWQYNHKLKAAALDVLFYILMPSMNKSMKIMHCRFDTPNGIGRMHSVLAIECDGKDYDTLWGCAFVTYFGCGFIFPLFLMVQLFNRSYSPSTHVCHNSIEVNNIPAAIETFDLLHHITQTTGIDQARIGKQHNYRTRTCQFQSSHRMDVFRIP
jgi:hypothetical protein